MRAGRIEETRTVSRRLSGLASSAVVVCVACAAPFSPSTGPRSGLRRVSYHHDGLGLPRRLRRHPARPELHVDAEEGGGYMAVTWRLQHGGYTHLHVDAEEGGGASPQVERGLCEPDVQEGRGEVEAEQEGGGEDEADAEDERVAREREGVRRVEQAVVHEDERVRRLQQAEQRPDGGEGFARRNVAREGVDEVRPEEEEAAARGEAGGQGEGDEPGGEGAHGRVLPRGEYARYGEIW